MAEQAGKEVMGVVERVASRIETAVAASRTGTKSSPPPAPPEEAVKPEEPDAKRVRVN